MNDAEFKDFDKVVKIGGRLVYDIFDREVDCYSLYRGRDFVGSLPKSEVERDYVLVERQPWMERMGRRKGGE